MNANSTNGTADTHTQAQAVCGWVKLYHASGALVTLPVAACSPLTGAPSPQLAYGCIDGYLATGFLVEAPGLEAGEQMETYHFVVRENVNDTPHLSLYRDEDKWRHLGVYLNNPEDVAAFEVACRVKLDALREYIGNGHIERGKSKQTDAMVFKLPAPVVAVWKPNPKHDPNTEEGKKKPSRLFVRWFEQRPSTSAAEQDGGGKDNTATQPAPAQQQPQRPPVSPRRPVPMDQRLAAKDALLTGEGLCRQGDFLKHVVGVVQTAGFPADPLKWGEEAVKIAMNAARAFEDEAHRAKSEGRTIASPDPEGDEEPNPTATLSREQHLELSGELGRTGKRSSELCAEMELNTLEEMNQAQFAEVMERLRKLPKAAKVSRK